MPVRGASQADFRQWPNVASAAQLPNVAGATIQNAGLAVGDTCFVTGGALYLCTVATLGAASWTSSGVLWRWNQTDTSQFGAAVDVGLGGTTGLSLTTVAGGPNGTLLRVGCSATVARGALFPISFTFPRRYVIDISFYSLDFTDTTTAGINVVGVSVAGTASGQQTLSLIHSNPDAVSPTAQALGVFGLSAGTPFGPALALNGNASAMFLPSPGFMSGVAMRYTVNTQRPFVSATPALTVGIEGSGADAVTPQTFSRVHGSARDAGAYPAGWDGATLNTIGLLAGNGGATSAWTADIESIVVSVHPDGL